VTVVRPPAPEPVRFEALLSLSWAVFRRNWIVALPPFIVLATYVVISALYFAGLYWWSVAHGGIAKPVPNENVFWVITGAYALLVVAAALWSFIATYAMADAAWAKGTASFGDAFAAFRTRSGAMLVAFAGVCGVVIAAVVLALPTLFLSLLAVPLVTMYVPQAVVSGRRGGFAALGESFRLVRAFFGPSAISLLVLLGIRYGIACLAGFAIVPLEFAMMPGPGHSTPHMPPIGFVVFSAATFVVALLVAEAYSGYYTIAVVGLFRALRAHPTAVEGLPASRSFSG